MPLLPPLHRLAVLPRVRRRRTQLPLPQLPRTQLPRTQLPPVAVRWRLHLMLRAVVPRRPHRMPRAVVPHRMLRAVRPRRHQRPRGLRPPRRVPPFPPSEAAAWPRRWMQPNLPTPVARVRGPRLWTRPTRGPQQRPLPPQGLPPRPPRCPEAVPRPRLPRSCSPARTCPCRPRRERCSRRAALTRGCCRCCPTPSATTQSCSATPSRSSTRCTRRPWTSLPSTASRSGQRTSRRAI